MGNSRSNTNAGEDIDFLNCNICQRNLLGADDAELAVSCGHFNEPDDKGTPYASHGNNGAYVVCSNNCGRTLKQLVNHDGFWEAYPIKAFTGDAALALLLDLIGCEEHSKQFQKMLSPIMLALIRLPDAVELAIVDDFHRTARVFVSFHRPLAQGE